MKINSQILGPVLLVAGACLFTLYFENAMQKHKRHSKKIKKLAYHDWEGEGGTILDTATRTPAGGPTPLPL